MMHQVSLVRGGTDVGKKPTIAEHFLLSLDDHITSCLGRPDAELSLMSAYWDIWEELKRRVGTSGGFTGVAEYLFFRYILEYIERQTGEHFEQHELTKDTSDFRSPSLILTHDIDIAKYVHVPKQKPDAAIIAKVANGRYRLLAAFEVKVYISSSAVLENMLRKFRQIGLVTDARLYPVLFNVQYQNDLDKFCEEFKARAQIISARASNKKYRHTIDLVRAVDAALEIGAIRPAASRTG